ncbi:MAG TPA: hypothetical protein VNT51_07950 [Miltoncostaeaceae bacterium]|nr:hypothetical protein [Miltoncostaeaceae bacterium]
MEPRKHAWIVPGRLAVAERPGGGGRAHRRERRRAEQAWWRDQGVDLIVSCMPTRHALVDYVVDGFAVRWHPLTDPESAPARLRAMAAEAAMLVETGDHVVLVHGDAATEWLAAVSASLRLQLGLAAGPREALAAAAADGLPVGSLASRLLTGDEPAVTAVAA